MGVAPPPSAARRRELADFLRTRRAAVRPADLGLADDGRRRRTPGLRREEVALHAGVGVSWYTWLEQGRDVTPSPQVLDALARTLRLDQAEHVHLFHLAGVTRPVGGGGYPREAPQDLAEIVDALRPHPAYLLGPRLDILAHNPAAALVLHDLVAAPPGRRNLLWWLFGTEWSEAPGWRETARANLADFRAEYARRPGEQSFVDLVTELSTTSPAFREWWAEHDVRAYEPTRKTIRHAQLGALALHQLQTVPTGHPELRLRILVPADEATRAAPR
ncbi:helix-turn-helix transcriptional regulator [Kribbella sancticallisti]|uniref:Helix-turn-helix transcriptional regulator n=1 Tax=Kribbella sancticallisti TaxID=460087 RepID=A0ABN2EYI1_9ACTN